MDSVDERLLGCTVLREPFAPAGFTLSERFLGIDDLYQSYHEVQEMAGWERGKHRGWHHALMEMILDPVLFRWVPKWVVEQYER